MRTWFILLFAIAFSCQNGPSTPTAVTSDLPSDAIIEDYGDGSGLSKATVKSGDITTAEGDLLNGLKHGTWVEYSNDGLITSLTNYRNGLKHGIALTFSNRSEVETKANYYNDQLEGEYVVYNRRKIKSITTYAGGKMHGPKKSFYDNGTLQEDSNYKDGIMHGEAKYYNNQGELLFEYVYDEGQLVEQE